jgi:thymidylate synthase (FAD)
MKVSLHTITPQAERTIVHIARVSSSRKDKSQALEGLIKYLIKNAHWSPFEHGHITFEIETSKAIGIQLIRHRSFTFQEFSQRYQDVSKVSEGGLFEPVELRKQAEDNRQSSTEVFNPVAVTPDGHWETAEHLVNKTLIFAKATYNELIRMGVAREQARMVLPMCTKTKIYMTGTIRSWIHFLAIRDDAHAQKEIQLIAKEMKAIFVKELPIISKALEW